MDLSCEPIVGGLEENATKIEEQCKLGILCLIPRILKRDSLDEYIESCVKCVSSANETKPGECPPIFDYYTCWDATQAGETAVRTCPRHFKYFNYFDHANQIHRTCFSNETWSKFPEPRYQVCLEVDKYFAFQLFVRSLNITGFLISTISLFLSLLIFYNFRSLLKCRRTQIHVQLFISFAMSSMANFIWELYVMDVPNSFPVLEKNPYFLNISNYFWTFCEGFNLFVSLVVVFIDGKYYMRIFYYIGWGLSLFIATIYGLFRGLYFDHLSHCWINYSVFNRIVTIPITLSLIIDCIFFICILKIICGKLTHKTDVKTAAKSAFILVTLLGIQHIFFMYPTPVHPPHGPTPMSYYLHYLMQTITSSFQGFAVACIFCFGNYDVQSALKSTFEKIKLQISFSIFGKPYFRVLSQRQRLVCNNSRTATSVTHSHAITSSTADV